MKNKSTKVTLIGLIASLIWIITLFLFNPHYISVGNVVEGWAAIKGLALCKDFVSFQLPFGRVFPMILRFFFGWNFTPDPFLALAAGIITLILIFVFGQRFLSPKATVFSLIFFSLFFWYLATGIIFFHEMIIAPLLLLGILITVDLRKEKKISTEKIILAGILISLAELGGQVASITAIVFSCLILCLIWQKVKKNLKQFFNCTLIFVLGLTLPWLPFLAYFVWKGALPEFLYWNFPYYFDYAGEAGAIKELPLGQLAIIFSPFVFLSLLLFLNLFNKKKVSFQSGLFFFLGISTIPFVFLSIFHLHHINYALPILAISAGLVIDYPAKTRILRIVKKIFLTGLVCGLAFIFSGQVLPWHWSRKTFPPDLQIKNDVAPGDDAYQIALWIKKNTSPQATLLILGDPLIFIRSDRLPSARPAHSIPYSWEPFEKIKKELASHPPDFWVIGETFTRRLNEDYQKPYMMEFVNQELESCYELRLEQGVWTIWERMCP